MLYITRSIPGGDRRDLQISSRTHRTGSVEDSAWRRARRIRGHQGHARPTYGATTAGALVPESRRPVCHRHGPPRCPIFLLLYDSLPPTRCASVESISSQAAPGPAGTTRPAAMAKHNWHTTVADANLRFSASHHGPCAVDVARSDLHATKIIIRRVRSTRSLPASAPPNFGRGPLTLDIVAGPGSAAVNMLT